MATTPTDQENVVSSTEFGVEKAKIGSLPPGATSIYDAAAINQQNSVNQHMELIGGKRRSRKRAICRKCRRVGCKCRKTLRRRHRRPTRKLRKMKMKRTKHPRKTAKRGGGDAKMEIVPMQVGYPIPPGGTSVVDVNTDLQRNQAYAHNQSKGDSAAFDEVPV